ncbi:MAG: BolA family protein [Enterobacteriaceae bacterium]
MSTLYNRIENKLTAQLSPVWLSIVNESHQHRVAPGSETHFKVVIVSEGFSGKKAVARHRMIYQILQEEMQNGVHALALHTYTQQEWASEQGKVPASPPCSGQQKNSGQQTNSGQRTTES